jgi:hypothetical protein
MRVCIQNSKGEKVNVREREGEGCYCSRRFLYSPALVINHDVILLMVSPCLHSSLPTTKKGKQTHEKKKKKITACYVCTYTLHPHARLASICHSICVCISPILDLPCLYSCSHAYSDTSVIVTQPNSINSYPG